MNGLAVLVAEDEPLASMALRAQLEALECRVLAVARDGDEAAALGLCLPVELAVFDMRMPARSGLEAAETVFRHAPTPVLLLSGFGAADLPDPLPRPPIFASVTKPIGLAELRQSLLHARDDFDRWADDVEDRRERIRKGLEQRARIARVLRAGEGSATQAALELLRRAETQGRTVLEIVQESHETEG